MLRIRPGLSYGVFLDFAYVSFVLDKILTNQWTDRREDGPIDRSSSSETKYCKSEIWGWETDFLANVN